MSDLPFVRMCTPITEEEKLLLQEICYKDKEVKRLYDFDMFCRLYNLTEKQVKSSYLTIIGRKKDRSGAKRLFNKLMDFNRMVSSIFNVKKDYNPIESIKELKELENEDNRE